MTSSREKRLFAFWMEFFIEGIKQESSGSQFPVRMYCMYMSFFILTSLMCMHMYIHTDRQTGSMTYCLGVVIGAR